ncbi:MAG: DUF1080 domain-containing protein [Planctomycetota bacterium]|nr:DUF1080 domain-containing protein [Planctomycetota bacterium]MDA1178160.1 DUF1080 domain-containing protein [Planctomycetota bacterium]
MQITTTIGTAMLVRSMLVVGAWCLAEPSVSRSEPASPPDEKAAEVDWKPLLEIKNKQLIDWKSTNFGGEGSVEVDHDSIVLGIGSPLTGITRTGSAPEGNYEIELEAQRVDGRDFFCALTFPVKKTHCSLVVGGWGGSVVGISSIDGEDASENDTTTYMKFERQRWYKIRLRVTEKSIQGWIDDEKVIDRNIEASQLSTRVEVDLSRPLGISTYETRAAIKNFRWRKL